MYQKLNMTGSSPVWLAAPFAFCFGFFGDAAASCPWCAAADEVVASPWERRRISSAPWLSAPAPVQLPSDLAASFCMRPASSRSDIAEVVGALSGGFAEAAGEAAGEAAACPCGVGWPGEWAAAGSLVFRAGRRMSAESSRRAATGRGSACARTRTVQHPLAVIASTTCTSQLEISLKNLWSWQIQPKLAYLQAGPGAHVQSLLHWLRPSG